MIVGGAQENTLLTVRGLLEQGHEVVLVSGPSRGPEGALLNTAELPGLRLVSEPCLVRDLAPLTDLRAYLRLRRFFRKQRFDIVHTHSSKAGILGRFAARGAGVPVIVHTVHGQPFHSYQGRWRNALYILAERAAARVSHRILAVAEAMVDQCVAAGVAPRDRYRVVYSGMELAPFLSARSAPELRAELGIPPEALVVGKIARLFTLKGHEFLIAAAAGIVRRFPHVRFLLIGDGSLRQDLEQAVAEQGLRQHFVFTGLVPPREIPRYTGIMDLLVHLSLREGLPRAVVQALASAVPAVGFDLDGTPEVIRPDETGLLCAPGDVDAVRDAVCELLGDPARRQRLGRGGRELVRERFSWQHMVDRIEAEYRECLNRRTGAAQPGQTPN